MRFFSAVFLGVCYANVAERSNEPVRTTLIPEVANPPKETKASVDARLALVAVCPQVTSNCSVPTGSEAQNEDLADALECMLKINITSIPPGPCHDVMEQFLKDHLNPSNRMPQGPQFPGTRQVGPQFPIPPTMLIMKPQSASGPSPIAELLQRMAAAHTGRPQPMMFPFQQDPRFQQRMSQNSRFPPISPFQFRSPPPGFPTHGFPPMFGNRAPMPWMDRDHSGTRDFRGDNDRMNFNDDSRGRDFRRDSSHRDSDSYNRGSSERDSDRGSSERDSDRGSYDRDFYGRQDSYGRSSSDRGSYGRGSYGSSYGRSSYRDSYGRDSSDRSFSDRDSYGRGSDRGFFPYSEDSFQNRNGQNLPAEEDGHWDYVWHSSRNSKPHSPMHRPRHMSSSSKRMGPLMHRMSPPMQRMPPPPMHGMPPSSMHRSMRFPSSRQAPVSARRAPPRDSSSSTMNPMMMMMLPRLMSQGSSSQSPMSGILMATMMKNMASSSSYEDYDYDYSYDYDEALDDYDYDYDYEEEAPSPMMSMIQKMLQQKLAARQATVQVSVAVPAQIADAPSTVDFEDPTIATQTANVEIAQSPRPRSDKKETQVADQVSYRSAP